MVDGPGGRTTPEVAYYWNIGPSMRYNFLQIKDVRCSTTHCRLGQQTHLRGPNVAGRGDRCNRNPTPVIIVVVVHEVGA